MALRRYWWRVAAVGELVRQETVELLFDALNVVSQAMAASDDQVIRDDLQAVVRTIQAAIQLALLRRVMLDADH